MLWRYYTAKQKPPYQRSGKAACQPGASRQAKLNQTQGPAVGAARIVPRICALLARWSFRLTLSIAGWRVGVKIWIAHSWTWANADYRLRIYGAMMNVEILANQFPQL